MNSPWMSTAAALHRGSGLPRVLVTFTMPLKRVSVHRGHAAASDAAPSPVAHRLLDFHAREQIAETERKQTLAEAKRTAQAVVSAAEEIKQLVATRIAEIAALATEIGLAVAREVVGAALDQGQVDPTPFVVRCLTQCIQDGGAETLNIHLAPEDLPVVLTALEMDPDLAALASGTGFHADRRAQRGTVRVETVAGRLLYDPLEVLQRISDDVRKAVHS